MGLLKANKKRVFVNVKFNPEDETGLQVPYKEGTEWKSKGFKAIDGYIIDFDLVDKIDATKKPYKELQITLMDGPGTEKNILTCRMFKPFSDGLLSSLGNCEDFSKPYRISPYRGKESGPGLNPPTYCSVRTKGDDAQVKWMENIPKIEYQDMGDGTTTPLRKERNEFFINLVSILKEKTNENRKFFEKIESESATASPVIETTENDISDESELD